MERMGFIFDEKACIGCNACQMACKDKNHVEMGFFYRKVDTVLKNPQDETSWVHVSQGCRHCKEPACVAACKTGAMIQRTDGTVTVNQEQCIGCGQCVKHCSFGAIFIDKNAKASKCDGCYKERLQGKQPACVEACLTKCLSFGFIGEEESQGQFYFPVNTKSVSPLLSQKRSIAKMTEGEDTEWGDLEKIQAFAEFWTSHDLVFDNLFRGTDATFTAPMWASTSEGEQILLNEKTLELIKLYHSAGYQPAWLEGNPPDYIGEQFRFLVYVIQSRTQDEAYEKSLMRQFFREFLLPTLRQLNQAVGEYVGRLEDKFPEKKEKALAYLRQLKEMEEYLSSHQKFNCPKELQIPRNPEIPTEEAKMIPTGGLNNCGGICVIRPTVQENCILKIESDCNENHSPQIRACVRGRGYRKTFFNPARLKYPMKRVGPRGSGEFQRISWEEAIDYISQEWKRITQQYGPASRYVLYGTGVEGIMRPGKQLQRLLSLDGGYLDFFNSYSSACINYVSDYIWGTTLAGNSASDLLNSKLLILWADNTAESIFGPERNYYLSQAKKQGIRIVVIDPRLSQTGVTYADDWFAIRPSTDGALAAAMAYVIWSEGVQDQHFMDTYCIGFDRNHMPEGIDSKLCFKDYLFGLEDGVAKTPEWAEEITGIAADRIRELARLYGTTKPACICTGLGAQRHGNGEQTARAIAMLACLTGNVGIKGGGAAGNISAFSEHACIENVLGKVENPYKGKIPTFLWTKAVKEGIQMNAKNDRITGVEKLDSNIKMLFCMASDVLVNQHGNINETVKILQDETKCEFILCSDIFMTPSARYADLVLPATSVFEGENLAPSWAGGNYFVKHNPISRPLFECRFEWEWLKELAKKLGYYEAFVDGRPTVRQWLVDNYEILRAKEPELPDYDSMSKAGGWQFATPVSYVAFEKEIREPGKYPFPTPSGKIEIFSQRLYELSEEGIPAIPKYVPAGEGPQDLLRQKYPLQLIGWHTRRRCHSIHDNNEWMEEIEKPGVWIHPEDARERGIVEGDLVEIMNDRGRMKIPAIVTNRIAKGVTAISQGGWYTPDQDGVDVRGCINVLTSSKPTPLAKGNPQHTNLVEIKKVEHAAKL